MIYRHVTLPAPTLEQLSELKEFWYRATGETPTVDTLVRQAVSELHNSTVGAYKRRTPRMITSNLPLFRNINP